MKVTPVKRKFGRYSPGEAFDLPDPVARVFVRKGKLAEYSEPVIETRVLEAEISPATGKPKRQYRRRDMQAEE